MNNKQHDKQTKLRFETLEPRQLLTTFGVDQPVGELDPAGASEPQVAAIASANDAAPSDAAPIASPSAEVNLNIPSGLPASFTTTVEYEGETLTLQLEKNYVFGENTKFLIDDGTGELTQFEHGEDRSFLGTVDENPQLAVSAWLGETGLFATIIRPGQASIMVEPSANGATTGQHRIFVEAEAAATHNHDHNGDGVPDHAPEDHTNDLGGGHPPGCTCSACCGIAGEQPAQNDMAQVAAFTPGSNESTSPEDDFYVLPTTLAPNRVIDVREFEIGVDIGTNALQNNYNGSTTQQKVDHAMSVAQGIPGNLDARFLRAAGIKHRLGTVIIRTSGDPFTVANGNDSPGLSAFRNYWNSNPGIVGSTHDLAVFHVKAGPSGLAYVNSVGTSNRYALSASNGATSWADGTLAHEFGHSWNLGHVPGGTTSSANFYEARPRSNGNTSGGSDDFISIMHGSGTNNIGRLSTGEANRVLAAKQSKLQFGDTVTNEPEVAPFGWVDAVNATGSPLTIDVIANDHDANNDVLDVQLRDTVSHQGGTISLSQDTGPGGRNEIIYTPPASISGTDFFHYTVVDSTGRTDWGAVYVTSTVVTVDTSDDFYSYDLGTPTSPIFSDSNYTAVRVSHQTTGDITWSGGVLSEDRPNSNQNAFNRDFVRGFSDSTWSHKLASGVWAVTLNMSDPDFGFDNMFVDAEGVRKVSDIDRPAGQNGTFGFNVSVTDGFLDLTFGDDDTSDPRWAVNRIALLRVGDAAHEVDLNATAYTYDFGTLTSPIFTGAERITPDTFGDITWSGTVQAEDTGTGNAFNRDQVSGTADTTWSHKISDGIWRVKFNMTDGDTALDNMFIEAEGAYGFTDLDRPIGSNPTLEFDVPVEDGELNIIFGDADTSNPMWAINRVVLTRIGDIPISAGPADFNEDGAIDGADLAQWQGDYGLNGDSDANADNQSTGWDFLAWQRGYGTGVASTTDLVGANQLNGSFEDHTGSTGLAVNESEQEAFSVNGSVATIPDWSLTAVNGIGGWEASDAGGSSDGTAYAFANPGVDLTLTSSEITSYSTQTGDVFTLTVDAGNNNGVTHDYTASLILGGNTRVMGTIQDATDGSSGPLSTLTFTYEATAADSGESPQVLLVMANSGGLSKSYLDNVTVSASRTAGSSAVSALLVGGGQTLETQEPASQPLASQPLEMAALVPQSAPEMIQSVIEGPVYQISNSQGFTPLAIALANGPSEAEETPALVGQSQPAEVAAVGRGLSGDDLTLLAEARSASEAPAAEGATSDEHGEGPASDATLELAFATL